MATTTVTNRVASQALPGEGVKVTLDATDSAKLATFTKGKQCESTTTSELGYINSIDVYGNSFTVAPVDGASKFSSTSPVGFLSSTEVITVTL